MKVRSPTRALCAWLGCCAISIVPGFFGSTNANAADPIKIGAVLPFSGGVELYGAQAKLGLDLAAADINAAGGILGRPVEIVYRDDGTRPNIATEAARKAVEEDGVLAVVGPITSQNLDAIVPVLASRKTPLLYATNYEGGKCSRYMFSFNTVPNQELDSLLPYMTKTFGADYFLLGADRDWPHRMFDAAEPLIAKLGGKVDNIYAAVPFVVASQDPKAKAFVARARAKAGPDMAISNYVETHYNTLIAVKAALEKAGRVDKEALIDALEGLKFDSPAGTVTMGKDHHATLNMFLAKTQGANLVEVQALGEIAPRSGCTPGALAR
jgi:ABC-type branched-subunit amino acid transport system substrate-binding protein